MLQVISLLHKSSCISFFDYILNSWKCSGWAKGYLIHIINLSSKTYFTHLQSQRQFHRTSPELPSCRVAGVINCQSQPGSSAWPPVLLHFFPPTPHTRCEPQPPSEYDGPPLPYSLADSVQSKAAFSSLAVWLVS